MAKPFSPSLTPEEQTQENIESQSRGYPVKPPTGDQIAYPTLSQANQYQRDGIISSWSQDTTRTMTDNLGRVVNGYFGMTGVFANGKTFNMVYQKSGQVIDPLTGREVEGARTYPFILRIPTSTYYGDPIPQRQSDSHSEYVLISYQHIDIYEIPLRYNGVLQVGEWGTEHAFVNRTSAFNPTPLLSDDGTLPMRVELQDGATEEEVIRQLEGVVQATRDCVSDQTREVGVDSLRRYYTGQEAGVPFSYTHDSIFWERDNGGYFTLFYENMFHCDFPVWDIQNPRLAEYVERYLRTGVREGEYDWGGDIYVPPFDTLIEDTSTIWNAQVQNTDAGKTRLTLSWGTPDLGDRATWVRRKWKVSMNLVGISERVTSTLIPNPTMLTVSAPIRTLEYLDRTTNLDFEDLISIAVENDCYKNVKFPSLVNDPSVFYDQLVYRVAFRVFSDDQVSDLGYVDYKKGDGWNYGFLTDPRTDDSVINIDYFNGIIDDPDIPDDGSDDDDLPDDGYHDPDYPDDDPDIDDGGDGINVGGLFGTTYKMTQSEVLALSDYFWNDGAEGFIEKYVNSVNDPIDCIISAGYMPVNASGTAGAQVYIGNVTMTGCTGAPIHTTTIREVIGSFAVPETYKSFLDYQPFTNIQIWLPYIGLKTLPANEYVGKTIKVAYCFDLITGGCKAQIYANDKFKISYDGFCMVNIPMTATNNSDVTMARAQIAVGSAVKLATDLASGNAIGAVSTALSAGMEAAMLKHTTETNGSVSGALASCDSKTVFLMFDIPMVQYPSTYDHNVGKPCELSLALSSCKGYTVCAEGVDVSGIGCTEEERAEIKQALTTGVIL